ncbi:unnamed protein product [Spirodela intermedia]|uniref:Uncharacterized protein n=2 Tax=Spirodela intermedia TaxID=51605 RepID=A0A7I8IB10_SPIIN|nr:unnamed protein product [Spirodela intermedia]CAA6654916.1 unnamed protein product [Spirodela intermedia]CAA7389632.1 unnamed protein product [Spirodela intermedia]
MKDQRRKDWWNDVKPTQDLVVREKKSRSGGKLAICNIDRKELKYKASKAPFRCNGCKELGFHSCYSCKEPCTFRLHRHCADPQPVLEHDFFKECKFQRVQSGRIPDEQYCDACLKLAKGFFYHCYDCGKDLHPTCANLPRFLSYEGLKLELKKKMPFNCCKCGWMNRKSGKGSWCYVSSCKTVAVHISCMKDMLQDNFLENKRMAMPEVVFTEKKGRSEGNLAKIKKAFKIAVPLVLAALLGDPVSFAVSLIFSLLST